MEVGRAVETVDGRWVLLVNGVQWGPAGATRDRSGAADTTFATKEEAVDAYIKDKVNDFTVEQITTKDLVVTLDGEADDYPVGFEHWEKWEQEAYLDAEHLLPGPTCVECGREINQYHEKYVHEKGEKASQFYPGSEDYYYHVECPKDEE